MTIQELYARLPAAKHPNIKVFGNVVLYDTGTTILEAFVDESGQLVPRNQATKAVLVVLGG